MFKGLTNRLVLSFLFLNSPAMIHAQVGGAGSPTTDGRAGTRMIDAGVPFLLIAPDARSGSMGDAGVALSPDANAIHWNPSKLAFLGERSGLSVSYDPWLQKLVPDISLSYLSGYKKLNERSAIGGSIRFFSLGQIQLTDINRNDLGIYSPSEFAVDGTFARRYGDNFSLGTTLRFIYSNLPNGQFATGQDTKAGTALAADASAYYRKPSTILGKEGVWAAGLNISNIGNKISYVENGRKVFLPTNLKLGGAATIDIDGMSRFTFALDLNKLLVPSPPVYGINQKNELYIVSGRDPSGLSVPAAIFSSFADAPGGLSEELQEISYSTGVEYLYNDQLAFRSGYFYECPSKGGRRYFTLGAGFRYSQANIDFAYTIASQENSPLANTLRFSLAFNFKPKSTVSK
jgi:hypothetical protein